MELLTANSPLVIGRFYSVPCINALVWNLGMTPIIGPLHEDKEHIGFDDMHWHIDWRFVSAWQLSRLSGSGRIPVQAKVISQKNTAGQIVERRLKCKREMPEFPLRPYGKNVVHWLEDLETAQENSRLKCGMICPHRGLPLAGCPVNDGIVVCPAHGLAWDVESGALVKRVTPEVKAAI